MLAAGSLIVLDELLVDVDTVAAPLIIGDVDLPTKFAAFVIRDGGAC